MSQRLNLRDHLSNKKDKKKNSIKDLQKQFDIEHIQFCKELKNMGVAQDLYLRNWPDNLGWVEENKELLQFYYLYDEIKLLINEPKERTINNSDNS